MTVASVSSEVRAMPKPANDEGNFRLVCQDAWIADQA